jgi:hypothetical protein
MPQMSLGNGYTIDLADGWTFVHALEDALKEMMAGYQKNCQDLNITAPGNDAHSQSFSTNMTQKAVSDHENWYNAKRNQLNTMIQNVTGMLQQYQVAETVNTIQWSAPVTYDPNQPQTDDRRGHGAV